MTTIIFPYSTIKGDLQLTVTHARLDGSAFPRDPFIRDSRIINVHDVGKADWSSVQLDVELTGPLEEIESIDPDAHNLKAVLAAHCPLTNYRQGVALARAQTAGMTNRWTGTIELMRANARGALALVASVTGEVSGVGDRILGSATPWTVNFDEPDIPQVEGTLRVKWEDFDHSSFPVLAEFAEHFFYTDLVSSPPTLYLNRSERFRGFEAVLDDRKRSSAWEKALHDSERVGIVRSVWMAMVNAAIAAIEQGEPGERPDWPASDWKAQVLRAVLPRIYPDRSPEEALAAASEEWQSGDGAGGLESRCEIQIGALVGASKLLRRRLTALSSDLGDSYQASVAATASQE